MSKKIIILTAFLTIILLTSCTSNKNTNGDVAYLINMHEFGHTTKQVEIMTEVTTPTEVVYSFVRPAPNPFWARASFDYLNFEEAVLGAATHIVVARYAGSRPFGDEHTEFEFVVIDEIFGETTERIFIFVQHMHANVFGHTHDVEYRPGDLSFEAGVDYLLPLIHTNSVHSLIERDGDRFIFIQQIVIDLDNPTNSMMYNESLDDHINGIDLDEEIVAEEIIAFVEELAEEIEIEERREIIIIDSDDIEEILVGSPRVWVVEVAEPISLQREQQRPPIWVSYDLYYVNVMELLKGEIVGTEQRIVFPTDSVLSGEQHIVAVVEIPDSGFHDLTSLYALFSMDQLEEIREILANSQ